MFLTFRQLKERVKNDPQSWYPKVIQVFTENYAKALAERGLSMDEPGAKEDLEEAIAAYIDEKFPTLYYNYITEDDDGKRKLAVVPAFMLKGYGTEIVWRATLAFPLDSSFDTGNQGDNLYMVVDDVPISYLESEDPSTDDDPRQHVADGRRGEEIAALTWANSRKRLKVVK